MIQAAQRPEAPEKPPASIRPAFRPAPPCKVEHGDVALCFATAFGCALVGTIGTAVYWSRGESTDLTALLVAGGAYFIMGASKQLQYHFRKNDPKPDAESH
jgi:hypothetical protein